MHGSNHDDWRNSERVVKIALYSPDQIEGLGRRSAADHLQQHRPVLPRELQDGGTTTTPGRFLYYATGGPGGGTTGPLVKRIRLVE